MRRVLAFLVYLVLLAASAAAAVVEIHNDGQLIVEGQVGDEYRVVEPPVPTYYNNVWQGDFHILAYSDKVPGVESWPLTVSDIIANSHFRPTYQTPDGSTGSQGTSVIATVSYRTNVSHQLIPQPTRTDITIGGGDRLQTVVAGQFGSDALVSSTHTFPDPPIGSTATTITTRFQAQNDITLHAGLLGFDAIRFGDLSSMFSSELEFDANAIRTIDPSGNVHFIRLSNATPRDAHLFAASIPLAVGGFFELIKETGSTWNSTSPSIRVDLLGLSGVSGRVAVQGWLAPSLNTSHDTLHLWPEWIDAPGTIPAGAVYEATFRVTATPPSRIWNGAATADANWTTAGNWQAASPPAPGASLEFGPVSGPGNRLTSHNDFADGTRFNGITFLSDAAAYTITGHAIQLGGPILNQSGNDQVISLPVELLDGVGAVDTGAAMLTLGNTVSGAGPLVKSGSGTLVLSGDATYTGDTTVFAGVLEMHGLDNNASTTIGHGTAAAELVTDYLRQRSLTIHANGTVTIAGGGGAGGTSVVNFLNIADSSGSFAWSAGGADITPVPEPATWLLVTIALAGVSLVRRR